jgi:hypothetical protein
VSPIHVEIMKDKKLWVMKMRVGLVEVRVERLILNKTRLQHRQAETQGYSNVKWKYMKVKYYIVVYCKRWRIS